MMEEADVRTKEISMDFASMGENIGGDLEKFQCFHRCRDDAWDLKAESVCASACALDAY